MGVPETSANRISGSRSVLRAARAARRSPTRELPESEKEPTRGLQLLTRNSDLLSQPAGHPRGESAVSSNSLAMSY